jgi:hypothetical protein
MRWVLVTLAFKLRRMGCRIWRRLKASNWRVSEAARGHQNLIRGSAVGIVGRLVVANHFGVAFDDGQQVIEVVRDAAGELSDRLQFLRLA